MKKLNSLLIAKIIMIVWFVVMLVGLAVGRYNDSVSGGEFCIGLMFWVYLTYWFNDRFKF